MGIPPLEGFENMGPSAVRAFIRGIQKMEDDRMKDQAWDLSRHAVD